MLEAAASGLPIIVTPNTGAEDFFSPGDPEGWLIPANDVDALCDALTEAKADREKTFQVGQRAAARAQTFSWDAYGAKVVENYRQILVRH
jgi:glycosyltransferase involved in cell wall biosynthesis